jgi:Sulfotransferase family
MNEAVPPENWTNLNRRIDELFGMLERIHASTQVQRLDGLDQRLREVSAELNAICGRLAGDESAERWNNMNRRIDEVFGMLQLLQSGRAPSGAPAEAPVSDRGLFVIGHARSGTTILADALNTSDDVCCLMEPYFYRSIDLANFAESFNSMHRGFGNPPIKGYWTPGFGGATGRGVIRNLRETYRYVGEKLAFRQREKDYDPDRFFAFAMEEFPKSPFVCVIRDPVKVTSSVIDMFENSNFGAETIAGVVRSQLDTYMLILRLALIVPSCFLLVHETIDSRVLEILGSHLAINLERAGHLYVPDFKRMPHTAEGERILADNRDVQALQAVYSDMKGLVHPGSIQIGTDQYANCRKVCEFVSTLISAAQSD